MPEINTEYIRAYQRNDGIVVTEYTTDLEIDLEIAKVTIDVRKQASNNKPALVLADVRNLKSVTPEARRYLAEPVAYDGITALAVVQKNGFQRLLVRAYFAVKKRYLDNLNCRAWAFGTREEAVVWLLSQPTMN